MSQVFFLILALMLTGCIGYWKKDISGLEIFNGIINTQLNLLRPMAVIKQKGISYYDMVDLESKHYKLTLQDVKRNSDSFEIFRIDKGTPLFIESVVQEKMDQRFIIIVAAGRIYSKEKKDWVRFEYIWANSGIRRTAPWDGNVDEQALKEIIDEGSRGR